mmetsp:Transcript_8499/g.26285  ORF Transcript_8499/g.26285 Transcript_8499/m.26285 type:complete len:232 (-) Transcript_8499:1236-1931(-)
MIALNASRSASVVASSVGARSHATLSRSSASSASRLLPPHASAALATAASRSAAVSALSSHGKSLGLTAHLSPVDAADAFLRATEPFFSKAISSSPTATTAGMSMERTMRRAMNSGLPPSRMSVPRPAMLVAMVTAPRRPPCATISDSRSTFSGLALSSSCGMLSSESLRLRPSLSSTLVVPTSTGRPFLCMRSTSVITAFHLAVTDLNTTSWLSSRERVRLGGTTTTSMP